MSLTPPAPDDLASGPEDPAAAAARPAPAAGAAAGPPRAKVDTWATLVRLVRRFGPHRGRTVGVMAVQLVRSVLDVAVPFLIGTTVGSLQGLEGTHAALPASFGRNLLWLGVAVGAPGASPSTRSPSRRRRCRRTSRTSCARELFSKVLALPLSLARREPQRQDDRAKPAATWRRRRRFYREVAFGYVEILLLVIGVVILSYTLHWTYGVAATVVLRRGVRRDRRWRAAGSRGSTGPCRITTTR